MFGCTETLFLRCCHIFNEASLGENVVKVIDMERSGATIAFDYFKDKIFSPDVAVKHPSILEEFERVRKLFL